MTDVAKELEFRHLEVLSTIDKIDAALTKGDPMLELHCQSVLKVLQEQEELVHILGDAAIHKFMAGMSRWKNIKLVEEATKTRSRKKVSADDL